MKTCETRVTQISNHPGGKQILFIPGGPGIDSSCFLPLTDELCSQASCYLVDLPGNGSNLDENVDFATWGRELRRTIASFSMPIVVAHSFGAVLVLTLPELKDIVEKIVLIGLSAGMTPTLAEFWSSVGAPDPTAAMERYASEKSDASYKDLFFAPEMSFYYFTQSELPIAKRFFDSVHTSHRPFEWFSQNFLNSWTLRELPEIPSLLLFGECDNITPPSCIASIPGLLNDDSRLALITSSGHFPWIEAPLDTARAILDFSV